MRKKQLLKRIEFLEEALLRTNNNIELLKNQVGQNARFASGHINEIESKHSKLREMMGIVNYLVSTKFLGKIKHKKLISKFKDELRISIPCYSSFEELKERILLNDIVLNDLRRYMDILKTIESEQEIVDYCEK